jgi:hypothetical protein
MLQLQPAATKLKHHQQKIIYFNPKLLQLPTELLLEQAKLHVKDDRLRFADSILLLASHMC